ncbi:MAG: DUF4254 domain-containing protein [Desulfovibrionales bacterium]
MMDHSLDRFKALLTTGITAQLDAVSRWHEQEPNADEFSGEGLLPLVLQEHWINFQLWHVEDEARRTDVGPEVIARCKRSIDGHNQKRNDTIEAMDRMLLQLIEPLLPPDAPFRYNTETMGMALDRLSIIALKIFHMREQTQREDVSPLHLETCKGKLAVLKEQHHDLTGALLDLATEYAEGHKRPKLYCQFKMYNDPELNPQLYHPGASAKARAGQAAGGRQPKEDED